MYCAELWNQFDCRRQWQAKATKITSVLTMIVLEKLLKVGPFIFGLSRPYSHKLDRNWPPRNEGDTHSLPEWIAWIIADCDPRRAIVKMLETHVFAWLLQNCCYAVYPQFWSNLPCKVAHRNSHALSHAHKVEHFSLCPLSCWTRLTQRSHMQGKDGISFRGSRHDSVVGQINRVMSDNCESHEEIHSLFCRMWKLWIMYAWILCADWGWRGILPMLSRMVWANMRSGRWESLGDTQLVCQVFVTLVEVQQGTVNDKTYYCTWIQLGPWRMWFSEVDMHDRACWVMMLIVKVDVILGTTDLPVSSLADPYLTVSMPRVIYMKPIAALDCLVSMRAT